MLWFESVGNAPRAAQGRTVVRERRNLRARAVLSSLTRSGGPVRYWALGLLVAFVVVSAVLWRAMATPAAGPPVIAYSELARAIGAGQVKLVQVENGGARLTAHMRAPVRVGAATTSTVTSVVPTRAVSL